MSKRADFLKALAHPTRIEILEILKSGEKCVCEIVPALGLEQSNVSQHLAVLREQGVVDCRKEGLQVFYRVKDRKVFKLLGAVDEMLLRGLEETRSTLELLKEAK